jgi:hypothetical protein
MQMLKQEKRKEPSDSFPGNESKRSKSDTSQSELTDLPQGLIHPTLHPNFLEFGDPTQTQQPPPLPGQTAGVEITNLSSQDISSANQYYTKQESVPTCQFPSTNSHANNNEESEFIKQA